MAAETIVRAVRRPARKRELGRGERVAAGRLAAAPAAAVARRPALQRLGAGRGRRHRAGGLRHGRARLAAGARARAGPGRASASRTSGCSSARTPISTTAARPPLSASATGCELWLHPATSTSPRRPTTRRRRSPAQMEIARQSGVPGAPLQRWARARGASRATGVARPLAPDRELVEGVAVDDRRRRRGDVIETPGHAPSHVVPAPARAPAAALGRPRARPHLALLRPRLDARPGRRVPGLARPRRRLDVRLGAAGHGRPFTDVPGHVEANRALVARRLDAVRAALRSRAGDRLRAAARGLRGASRREHGDAGC